MSAARIFVYGSLLVGEENHFYLRMATLLGSAQTEPGYYMVNLGPYPAMVAGGDGVVEGEVYDVDAPTLAALDELEEHPDVYQRVPIQLSVGPAQTYVMTAAQAAVYPLFQGSNWRQRAKRERSPFSDD